MFSVVFLLLLDLINICGISIGVYGIVVLFYFLFFVVIGIVVGLIYYLVVVFVDFCGVIVVVGVIEFGCVGGVWGKNVILW